MFTSFMYFNYYSIRVMHMLVLYSTYLRTHVCKYVALHFVHMFMNTRS